MNVEKIIKEELEKLKLDQKIEDSLKNDPEIKTLIQELGPGSPFKEIPTDANLLRTAANIYSIAEKGVQALPAVYTAYHAWAMKKKPGFSVSTVIDYLGGKAADIVWGNFMTAPEKRKNGLWWPGVRKDLSRIERKIIWKVRDQVALQHCQDFTNTSGKKEWKWDWTKIAEKTLDELREAMRSEFKNLREEHFYDWTGKNAEMLTQVAGIIRGGLADQFLKKAWPAPAQKNMPRPPGPVICPHCKNAHEAASFYKNLSAEEKKAAQGRELEANRKKDSSQDLPELKDCRSIAGKILTDDKIKYLMVCILDLSFAPGQKAAGWVKGDPNPVSRGEVGKYPNLEALIEDYSSEFMKRLPGGALDPKRIETFKRWIIERKKEEQENNKPQWQKNVEIFGMIALVAWPFTWLVGAGARAVGLAPGLIKLLNGLNLAEKIISGADLVAFMGMETWLWWKKSKTSLDAVIRQVAGIEGSLPGKYSDFQAKIKKDPNFLEKLEASQRSIEAVGTTVMNLYTQGRLRTSLIKQEVNHRTNISLKESLENILSDPDEQNRRNEYLRLKRMMSVGLEQLKLLNKKLNKRLGPVTMDRSDTEQHGKYKADPAKGLPEQLQRKKEDLDTSGLISEEIFSLLLEEETKYGQYSSFPTLSDQKGRKYQMVAPVKETPPSVPTGAKAFGAPRAYRNGTHKGYDFGGKNTKVYAIAGGDLSFKRIPGKAPKSAEEHGTAAFSTYRAGNQAILKTDLVNGKTIKAQYFHLEKYTAKEGRIEVGEEIGIAGSTGMWSPRPHLHFQLSVSGKFLDTEELKKLIPEFTIPEARQTVLKNRRVAATAAAAAGDPKVQAGRAQRVAPSKPLAGTNGVKKAVKSTVAQKQSWLPRGCDPMVVSEFELRSTLSFILKGGNICNFKNSLNDIGPDLWLAMNNILGHEGSKFTAPSSRHLTRNAKSALKIKQNVWKDSNRMFYKAFQNNKIVRERFRHNVFDSTCGLIFDFNAGLLLAGDKFADADIRQALQDHFSVYNYTNIKDSNNKPMALLFLSGIELYERTVGLKSVTLNYSVFKDPDRIPPSNIFKNRFEDMELRLGALWERLKGYSQWLEKKKDSFPKEMDRTYNQTVLITKNLINIVHSFIRRSHAFRKDPTTNKLINLMGPGEQLSLIGRLVTDDEGY